MSNVIIFLVFFAFGAVAAILFRLGRIIVKTHGGAIKAGLSFVGSAISTIASLVTIIQAVHGH